MLAAGGLDPTFGVGGRVITDFHHELSKVDEARAIAITPTGKIVAVGRDGDIAEYNADGSLNSAFGDHGLATFYGAANGVTLQADGKILVVGYTSSGNYEDFLLARYNANGTLDTTFDGDGKVLTDFGGRDFGNTVIVQTDGKILMGGVSSLFRTSTVAARFNADGALDTSFGDSGKLLANFEFDDVVDSQTRGSLALQSDGKIILAGSESRFTGHFDFAVQRFNADGTEDPSFNGGMSTADIGGLEDRGTTVAVQADGKVLVAGYSANNLGKYSFAMVRFNVNGTLDTSFDGDGKLTTSFGTLNSSINDVLLQNDGKILVAGYQYDGNEYKCAMARYNVNGSLDGTFGTFGKLTTDFGGFDDVINGLALQSDGKIVAAGYSTIATGTDIGVYAFGLARINVNGAFDLSFDGDGKVLTDINSSHDLSQAVAVQGDGKIIVAGYSSAGYGILDVALSRYNADGSLDPSFDGDGRVITPIRTTGARFARIAVQADGKIVFLGSSVLARYNLDGSLDTSFGGDGMLQFYAPYYAVGGLALQGDGKIIVAGLESSSFTRYNANGTLDTTFDGDGSVSVSIGQSSVSLSAAIVQGDGKIVVVGTSDNHFVLARYNNDGTPDTSFGNNGKVVSVFGDDFDYANTAAIANNGKIIVAGASRASGSSSNAFAVARYNPDGALDTSFGGVGRVITDIISDQDDELESVQVQSDGKIVAAGMLTLTGDLNAPYEPAVVRYKVDGSLDASFGVGGLSTGALARGTTPYSLALQSDGRILVAGSSWNGNNYDFALARLEGATAPALLGDYNQNGTVDAADYTVWQDSLGGSVTRYSGADGSGNGVIDAADYVVWKANFGQTLPPPGAGGGTGAPAFSIPVFEIGETVVPVAAETTAEAVEVNAFAARAAGFASLEGGSLRNDWAFSRERLNIRRVTEFAGNNLLLLLASDHAGYSSRHDFSVVDAFGSEGQPVDDVDSQSLTDEPLTAALAEWR